MKTNALAPDCNDSARRACRWLASGLVVAMLLSTSDDARAEYEDSNQSQSQSQAGSSSGGFSFFKKPGTKTEVTSGHGSPDISQARMEGILSIVRVNVATLIVSFPGTEHTMA